MNSATETFLAQCRMYLFEADTQVQQDVQAELIARAYWPSLAPRRRSKGRARASKAGRPAGATASAR
jgi:hypothetical protein